MLHVAGNDTIDRYPPACSKVEKILCVSEKIFKKVVKDFEAFFKGVKGRPKQRSLNIGQINEPKSSGKATKPKTKSHDQLILPYSAYEPSSLAENIGRSRNHRVGRVNDWHSTYGQGMYE